MVFYFDLQFDLPQQQLCPFFYEVAKKTMQNLSIRRINVILLIAISVSSLSLPACTSLENTAPAYLLVDAVETLEGKKQPTWIALYSKRRKTIHLPVGQMVHQLRPGRYRLTHIDFQANSNSSTGTIQLSADETDSIDLEPNTVNYLGRIELLSERGLLRREWKIAPSQEMFQQACLHQPEIFSGTILHLVIPDESNKKYSVRCELDPQHDKDEKISP